MESFCLLEAQTVGKLNPHKDFWYTLSSKNSFEQFMLQLKSKVLGGYLVIASFNIFLAPQKL